MPLRIPTAAELAPVLRPHRAVIKTLLLVARLPADDEFFAAAELLKDCEDGQETLSVFLDQLTDRVSDRFAIFDQYQAEVEQTAEASPAVPRVLSRLVLP